MKTPLVVSSLCAVLVLLVSGMTPSAIWLATPQSRLSNGVFQQSTALQESQSSPSLSVGLNLQSISKIAASGFHTCALTSSGGVKCWGANFLGQLGNGTVTDQPPYGLLTPVDVDGLTNGVSAIDAGAGHTCAVVTGGRVKCWGMNGNGGLGDGSTVSRHTPVYVCSNSSCASALSSVIAVGAGSGSAHTCALISGGGVKCWGWNLRGQLGDGSTLDRHTPVDVVGLAGDAIAVTAGNVHTCALMANGRVQCWGNNLYGQLGDGTAEDRLAPVSVCADEDCTSPLDGVIAISAGDNHTCALTSGGGVKCWGWNDYGQLGNRTTGFRSTFPVNVCADADCALPLAGISAITTGNAHTCALTTSGGVRCWGTNGLGQLGDGTTADHHIPWDVCADSSCALHLGGINAISIRHALANCDVTVD